MFRKRANRHWYHTSCFRQHKVTTRCPLSPESDAHIHLNQIDFGSQGQRKRHAADGLRIVAGSRKTTYSSFAFSLQVFEQRQTAGPHSTAWSRYEERSSAGQHTMCCFRREFPAEGNRRTAMCHLRERLEDGNIEPRNNGTWAQFSTEAQTNINWDDIRFGRRTSRYVMRKKFECSGWA